MSDSLFDLISDPAILAAINAAYSQTAPIQKHKATHVSVPKIKKEKEQKRKPSYDVTYIIPPPVGPQDHAAFLAALREAGYCEVISDITGLIQRVHDPIKERQDQRDAIALYQGWTDEALGTQLDRAVCHARFSLLPKGESYSHRSSEQHAAKWSVEGFVSGLPNAMNKVLADLAARERTCVEELSNMTVLAEAASTDPITYERRLASLAKDDPGVAALIKQRPELLPTLVKLAEARLAEVQADLDSMYSEDGSVSVETIERAHRVLSERGMPTFQEAISMLGTKPKD